VAPIAERTFAASRGADGGFSIDLGDRTDSPGGVRLTFVNGEFVPALSRGELPRGAHVSSLSAVLASNPASVEPYLGRFGTPSGRPFTALNSGLFHDGAFIHIPPGTIVEQPISVVFASAASGIATVSYPRVLIAVGENSQVRIVESYVGQDGQAYFTNAVTEVAIGAGAVVDHYRLQRESRQAFHVGGMYVRTARDSSFSSLSIAFGGALVRNDVVAVLDGEGGDCTLNGLYLVGGRRLVDNHTTIDHAKPHCGSHEMYKGILGGHGRAVFNGKIIVRPDAQKTDAKQTNRALLLSDDAQINTKPQLEIFANDVKCTHGAAVGQLDEDQLFYLRARGLGLQQAREILIHAFAAGVLDRIPVATLKASLEGQLSSLLPDIGQ
jgi:Fe-S cluster assembly protein SufD